MRRRLPSALVSPGVPKTIGPPMADAFNFCSSLRLQAEFKRRTGLVELVVVPVSLLERTLARVVMVDQLVEVIGLSIRGDLLAAGIVEDGLALIGCVHVRNVRSRLVRIQQRRTRGHRGEKNKQRN